MFDIKKTTQSKSEKTHEVKDEKSAKDIYEDMKKQKSGNTMNKIKKDLEKERKQALGEKEPKFDTSNVKVHTMPDKFLVASGIKPAVNGKRSKKKGAIKKNVLIGIIIAVVVVGILVLGFWLLLKTIETPEEQAPPVIEEVVDDVEEEDVEEEPQEVCSLDNCRLCNEQECLDLKEDCHLEDLCESRGYRSEELCPEYLCVAGPAEEELDEELAMSRDSDSDLLTDTEELLWGSDPLNSDTDSDGYNDGEEIKNFYNPTIAGVGTSKLDQSDLVKIYPNSEHGYSIYYPASWRLRESEVEDGGVMFIANTNEFVQVIVEENSAEFLTAKSWFLAQNPDIDEDGLEEVIIGNWSGIKHPDGLKVYLIYNDYIYTLTMNIGLKTELNYKTTFDMMVNNFRLFESPLD